MVVKSDRENQRHHEQQDQHTLVIRAHNQQEKEAHDENHELSRDHVREDRSYKKSVLTLEKRQAVWAVMPDMKRSCDDSGLATGGTTQSQRTPQHLFDLFNICFHVLPPYYVRAQEIESPTESLDTARGLR